MTFGAVLNMLFVTPVCASVKNDRSQTSLKLSFNFHLHVKDFSRSFLLDVTKQLFVSQAIFFVGTQETF